eukprot:UN22671
MKYVFIFRFLCIFCRDYFRNRGYRLNVFSGMYHINDPLFLSRFLGGFRILFYIGICYIF